MMGSECIPPNTRPLKYADLFLLVCALIATRVIFRSRYLYDIDSVNFALGMRRFDPAAHQPHPPGYYLYVTLGRLVNVFIGNANTSLVAISIAASCGALIVIYALANEWFDRNAAVFAGLIFLFSPLVWFHGTVALTYSVEAFFSALTGYLCWRVASGSEGLAWMLALTTGVAAGFRPSFLLFLAPALIFSVRGLNYRRVIAAVAILAATLLAWGTPMVLRSGGLMTWWSALISLWGAVPGTQTVFNSSPANSIARIVTIAGIYILCFGSASLFTPGLSRADAGQDSQKQLFTWIWITPGLLFFAFIFLKFVNSGYLLVVSPPVFVWLGGRASQSYAGLRIQKHWKMALLVLFAGINSLIFIYAPVYCSYSAVHRFETELDSALRAIPQVASPADTLIIGLDSHFLGYRHAGYYLPDYFVAQYPEVRLSNGLRIFTMNHGGTHLEEQLPDARFTKFLFFPLPSGDSEYGDYMLRLRRKLPQDALRTVTAEGQSFLVGPVADLPLLFPPVSTLSAARDAGAVSVAAR
jgi:hypothetical protein